MSNFDPANYAPLKTELTTDPKGLGLVAMTGLQAAAKLNLIGASGEFEAVGTQSVIDAWRVANAIDLGEYSAAGIAANQRSWLAMIMSAGKVDVSNATVRANFGAMFTLATSPTTRAALLALTKRSVSRIEALFGDGIYVDEADVIRARSS